MRGRQVAPFCCQGGNAGGVLAQGSADALQGRLLPTLAFAEAGIDFGRAPWQGKSGFVSGP